MSETHRVLWGEGMLLTPQHFQQWDRHQEAALRERIRSVCANDWGLARLEIDQEALRGGKLGVRLCSGVLPDGAAFDAPARDRLPGDRALADVAASSEGVVAYLAMPQSRTGGVTCDDAAGAAGSTPFVRGTVKLADATKAGSEREVAVALGNLSIRFAGESLDDFRTLPFARIVASPTGGFDLDARFTPPCTWITVAPAVQKTLRRTIEVLTSRAADLAGQQRKTGGMAEVAAFWLLHTFNAHLPALVHAHTQGRVHPETVYLELARLAAELCTFAGGYDVRAVPAYDHGDLTATFGELDRLLAELLDIVVPSRCVPIPLERTGDSLFKATVHDDKLLVAGQVYLGVLADVDEARLLREFPGKTKVSSNERLNQLLMMAMPGCALKHVAVPPPDIPVQPGRIYFQLVKAGDHWDSITQTRSIAMHVPPDFPGLRIELMSVKE